MGVLQGMEKEMKKFRDFESAREFARKLNLKSQKEWLGYCKSGMKPDDIPASPNKTYKKDFKGMGDFLGNGNIQQQKKQYRPFTEAREFVRSLKLNGQIEWIEYCKSGDKPDDVPTNPHIAYKNEWKGTRDWVGTNFSSFVDSREFVRSLGLKSQIEWYAYSKSGNKPDNIPTTPQKVYKDEWKGWGDFLGTGNTRDKNFLSFNEAREFVRKLGLKGLNEWFEYCKSGNKPKDIPSNPNLNYKNNGWKSYGDWVGNDNIASQLKQYRPFKEAREFVRKLGLNDTKEWKEYCKSGDKPKDIPSRPERTYKKWKKK
jgi:hypothetical protein